LSYFFLPYSVDGKFVSASQPMVQWILFSIGGILLLLKWLSLRSPYTQDDLCLECCSETLTGIEIRKKFPSLPIRRQKEIDLAAEYKVLYVERSWDYEGLSYQQFYAFQIGDWTDTREFIQFPQWVLLIPYTLAFFFFLAALWDRTSSQFATTDGSSTVGSILLEVVQSGHRFMTGSASLASDVYPLSLLLGGVVFSMYLVYFVRRFLESPTIHAVD
jgi:hypothetical protein